MAYLSATDLNDLQEVGGIDEKRFFRRGLVDAAADSTPATSDYISPTTVEQMQRLSSARRKQLPVINDQTITVETSNVGFNFIPSNLPTSDQYTFTAVDIFSGARFFPASYEDNAIDMEWEKRRRLKAVLDKMAKTKETLIASTLNTRKTQLLNYTTQVSQGDGTFSFNTGTDVLEINKAAQKDTMYFYLKNLMAANELEGDYRFVTSPGGTLTARAAIGKYGSANDKNLQAFGFFDESMLYESQELAPGSDVFSGYMFKDGAIGLIENFPWDFRNGTVIGGRSWAISDMQMRETRSRLNVYINNEATGATSLVNSSNMKMTHFQEIALWDRFYIVYRYNSDLTTRVQDIVKITGLTS